MTLSEFQTATEQADREGQRRAFYLLANYYGRTLYILRGPGHAPLLYAKDPRADLPTDLQRRVAEAITGRDQAIVAGWLRKEATGGYQATGQ